MLFFQMLRARLQPDMHKTRSRLRKEVVLLIVIGVLLLSVLLFNMLRPFSSVPAPVPSSLALIFARDSTSAQPQIYSISGYDASLHWKQTFDLSSPLTVVQGGVVYVVGYDEKNQANRILALHTSDGSLLWNTPLQINASSKGRIATQPIIADGNIYLSVLGISEEGQVLAVRTSDGKQLWSVSLSNYSNSDNDQPLAAGSGLLFVGSTDGMIHAYQSSNGAVAWNYKVSAGGYNRILPVFSNETIFTLSPLTNEVVAVHARDGQVQWRLQQANLSPTSLVVKGTHLYVSGSLARDAGNYAHILYTFDTRTRQLLWQHSVPNNFEVNIEEADGVAYVTSAQDFYALHADTGTLIWQKQEQDNSDYGQPTIVNGVVFVKTYLSRCLPVRFFWLGCSPPLKTIDAFRASDGFHYWEYTTDFADRNTDNPLGIANDSNH